MRRNRTGRKGRDYDGLVSKLPPHAVTKLAADVARRLFESSKDRPRPTSSEIGACARAVGALSPKEREQHARTLGRINSALLTASLTPPIAEIFVVLFRAKISEAAALTETKVTALAHRSLIAAGARDLRLEGQSELTAEYEQALAALDQQLGILGERLALATAEVSELAATDPIAAVLAETRTLETALGIDIATGALLDAAATVQCAHDSWKSHLEPALKSMGELCSQFESGPALE